jgi:hypothetical protein
LYFFKYATNLLGVGPILGAFLATGLYLFMKVLDYEQVNGNQDKDELDLELRTQTSRGHFRAKPRPKFENTHITSYMHGSHIAQPSAGQPAVIDQDWDSSETHVGPQSDHSAIVDLRVVDGPKNNNLNTTSGSQGNTLTTAEKMV